MTVAKDVSSPELTPPREAPANGSPPKNGNGRHRIRILLGVLVLALVAAGVAGYWYFFMRGIVFTDDARLGGHLVNMAPELNGTLAEVFVHEGEFVHAGQDVFSLDSVTQQATLNEAKAALVSAQAGLAASRARCAKAVNGNRPEEIKAADATVKRLRNEADLAQLQLGRTETLKGKGIASQEDLDRDRSAYESAKQNLENATQILAVLQLGSRQEDLDVAKADVALAESQVVVAGAAVDRARKDLDRCLVKAPFDGWVVRRWLDPGAMPIIAQPVVSLFDPATLRVDANIEEKDLNRVALGDPVEITLDAYPDLRLTGRVTEILRATNSRFSLIPTEGVSGTFIKVTERVPLRISVSAPPDVPLGPGLSAEVRIRSAAAESRAAPTQGMARD